jgi:signal recognition particle subunit SRP54
MVMEGFGDSLKKTFRKITRMGSVDKEAVELVVKDLQRAMIAADVDVSMVVELSARIKKQVLDKKPPSGITVKEHFIKVLYDELVSFLGADRGELDLKPQRILLIGLFGSGKTSTAGKLAKWFKTRGLSAGLVACDTYRPAARDQLKQLGKKVDCKVYEKGTLKGTSKKPSDIAKAAIKEAKEDVLIFDSAGRDALDKELARELKDLGKAAKPDEVLLVIPADIGQAARKQAEEFNKLVGITGIIVTKLDGTARGGGALSAASVSGARVRMIGVGEKIGDLEVYDPKRFVGRLIGYGDLEGLLEKAKDVGIDKKSAEKIMKGEFTLDEFYEQIGSMQKMGNLSKVVEMIPGISGVKIPKGMLDVQEEKMKKWKFAIDSMTPEERRKPETIKHSRVQRIARGSGLSDRDVRELLKYFKQTQKIMKMTKGGKGLKRGPLAKFAKQFGLQA